MALYDDQQVSGGLTSALAVPRATVRAAGLRNFVEERAVVKDATHNQPVAGKGERPGQHAPLRAFVCHPHPLALAHNLPQSPVARDGNLHVALNTSAIT